MGRIDSIIEVTAIFIEKGEMYVFDFLEDFTWKKDIDTMLSFTKNQEKFLNKEKLERYEMINLQREQIKKYKVKTEDKNKGLQLREDFCEATENAIGFRFEVLGDNTNLLYSSGMAGDLQEAGSEIFDEYLNDFEKKAKEILEERNKPVELELTNFENLSLDVKKELDYPYIKDVVKFYTAWEYNSSKDSWSGEWDVWYNLIGYFNFQDISKIIKKEIKRELKLGTE